MCQGFSLDWPKCCDPHQAWTKARAQHWQPSCLSRQLPLSRDRARNHTAACRSRGGVGTTPWALQGPEGWRETGCRRGCGGGTSKHRAIGGFAPSQRLPFEGYLVSSLQARKTPRATAGGPTLSQGLTLAREAPHWICPLAAKAPGSRPRPCSYWQAKQNSYVQGHNQGTRRDGAQTCTAEAPSRSDRKGT